MSAELIALRADLLRMKYSGVLTIKHGDNQTTFRSMAEIDQALADLEAQIEGRPRSVTRVVAVRT